MKLIQCANAYAAILSLERQEMNCKTAYALVRLKRALQPDAEFYLKEEKDLIDAYADRDGEGKVIWMNPARVQIGDPERSREFEKRRTELGELEAQEGLTPRRAPMPETVTPAQLEALEGFIEFDGGE